MARWRLSQHYTRLLWFGPDGTAGENVVTIRCNYGQLRRFRNKIGGEDCCYSTRSLAKRLPALYVLSSDER